jgi:hypothetical protein
LNAFGISFAHTQGDDRCRHDALLCPS